MRKHRRLAIAAVFLCFIVPATSPTALTAQTVFVEGGTLADYDPTLRSETSTTVGLSGGIGVFGSRHISARVELDFPQWHTSDISTRHRLLQRIEVSAPHAGSGAVDLCWDPDRTSRYRHRRRRAQMVRSDRRPMRPPPCTGASRSCRSCESTATSSATTHCSCSSGPRLAVVAVLNRMADGTTVVDGEPASFRAWPATPAPPPIRLRALARSAPVLSLASAGA